MFTGIIENTGIIKAIEKKGTNTIFWVESSLAQELKVDQSLSHNGVCLTVEEIREGTHRVTAIHETLQKTNLAAWQIGHIINLERCLQLGGRLDGHLVQGHIDCTAECLDISEQDGSWEFRFAFPEQFASMIIEKGSVTVNGISLTCFAVTNNRFTVAIIPYTMVHTNMGNLKKGEWVNIEWDLIGKYVQRMMKLK